MPTLRMLTTVAAIALLAAKSHGQAPSPVKKLEITPAMQNTLDEWKKKAQVWADNPVIVAAVTEQNKIGPVPSMTKRSRDQDHRRARDRHRRQLALHASQARQVMASS